MAVLIMILKIAGIVLLVLLVSVLLVLGAALLVPVRYRISGQQTAGFDTASVQVRMTWLLHLLTYRMTYRAGETESGLYICGIRRRKRAAAEEESEAEEEVQPVSARKRAGNAAGAEADQKTGNEACRAAEASADRQAGAGNAAGAEADQKTGSAACRAAEADQKAGAGNAAGASPDQKTGSEAGASADRQAGAGSAACRAAEARTEKPRAAAGRLRALIRKGRAFIRGIPVFFGRLIDSAARLYARLSDIRAAVLDEANRTAVAGILAELRFLLRHFRFRRIYTELSFSLGDPAATGQALGAVSMLPFLYRYDCGVYPDFLSEEAYIRGEFEIRGKARMLHVLRSLIRLWRQREFRIFIKRIMN